MRQSVPLILGTAAVLILGFPVEDARPDRLAAPRSAISPPQGFRGQLTASDLLSGHFPEVVHNDYFLPVGDAGAAGHSFSGVISFSETALNTTRPDSDWGGSGQRFFPEFSLPVFRQGDSLIPLERGIVLSGGRGRSFWNVIVSPGRVWREAGDGGWSRASFPFVLTDNYVGQALNGTATFLFTSTGISQVAVQIVQETSPKSDYTRGDFNGAVPARFAPRLFAEAGRAVEDRRRELAARPPIRAWAELPLGGFTRAFFNAGLREETVSFAALFIDGALYVQPAETRAGPYPYPLEMRHGVYSVTKTLVMGLSMFYCAERYGEAIFEERITNYVPELAGHPGWAGVTFGNALDMATGTAGDDRNLDFIRARSAAEKLAVVRGMPDAPYAPGNYFDYSSSNTFTLSCALDRYVKAREGLGADYWLLVRDNVLEPLGAGAMAVERTREPDGTPGPPLAGWSAYPTAVEAVMIGRLISEAGVHDGRQILNGNKVREALERTSRRGLPANLAATRYLHSFWLVDVGLVGGAVTGPYMSGHGGNFVFVLTGEIVALRFADENNFDVAPMIAVAEFYRRVIGHS